jgi:hypothetical protein
MDALIAAGIIGVVGGIVGSLFIRVNNLINVVRKKILGTNKYKKIAETCCLVILTVSAFFFSAYLRNQTIVCLDAKN